MTNFDIIKMAFKNLSKRKLRTSLTILSVVIGATSIIVMISLGIALNESFDKQIKEMGNITNITVFPGNDGRISSFGSSRGPTGLTSKDINKFKSIEGVEAVTPTINSSLRLLVNGDKYVGTVNAIGIDPSTADLLGYTPIEGVGLTAADEGTYNIIANPFIAYYFDKKGKGEPYPKWIYDENDITPEMEKQKIDLLNQKITITTDKDYGVSKKHTSNTSSKDKGKPKKHKTFKAKIVGVVNKSTRYGDNNIIMPIDTLEKIIKETNKVSGNNNQKNNGYNQVIVKAKTIDDVQKVIDEIRNIGKYEISSPIDIIASMKKTSGSIQILLGAIGGISLFIAAIGITNTMVMAIYERTREIGIMKVIGARVSDIKRLFLLESILIGFLGGFLGVLFSYLVSFTINKAAPFLIDTSIGLAGPDAGVPKVSSIPFWLSISALIFSSVIGLMAGYFPAKRAVKLEALKAIKSE